MVDDQVRTLQDGGTEDEATHSKKMGEDAVKPYLQFLLLFPAGSCQLCDRQT